MFRILLLVSLATFFATFASSEESKYLGNTDLLRKFYANIINAVKDEGNRMLHNELTKIYTNQADNNTQTFMRERISNLYRIYDFQTDPICDIVDGFEKARWILKDYSQLLSGQNSVMDAIYKRVESQCPSTPISTVKDGGENLNPVRSTEVTLMLTYSSGLGEFMRRSLAPSRFCCMFSEKAEGEANLIKFYLNNFYSRGYLGNDEKVALWAKGHYLTISGGKLKWDKVANDFGQEWKMKNLCNYSVVKYCDLVSFYSNDNRKYLGRIYTASNVTDGTFVILGPDGKIPQ